MFAIAARFVRVHRPLLFLASSLLAAAPQAHADDISFVNTFRNIGYQQTGNGNTLTFDGTFFSADLQATAAGVYNKASVTLPNGTSIPLTENVPADYGFQTTFLPDKATMDTLFPQGTYTFTGTNGAGSDTATAIYSRDDFSKTLPFLMGSNYTDLQNLNASHAFTFNLSPDVPGGGQTDAFIFLSIFNQSSGALIFTQGFLPPSTSSITLGGGTLAAGTNYVYELDYSNRDIANDLNGGQFPAQLGFDLRTDGTFSTAAAATPEPSSLLLAGTGLMAGIAAMRRRLA